jgi:hypothetical protein
MPQGAVLFEVVVVFEKGDAETPPAKAAAMERVCQRIMIYILSRLFELLSSNQRCTCMVSSRGKRTRKYIDDLHNNHIMKCQLVRIRFTYEVAKLTRLWVCTSGIVMGCSSLITSGSRTATR